MCLGVSPLRGALAPRVCLVPRMRFILKYIYLMSVYSHYQRARISLYDTYAVLKLVVINV
jgi:hypothetical protein